jgi:hypothetical protein
MRLCFSFPGLPVACLLSLTLTGCSLSSTSAPTTDAGLAIHGSVHGGQQPIVGAEVYLLAANTTGYGQPSVSKLSATSTGYSSSLGAYVPTSADGSFTITGDYSCTPNTQVYLYSLGGSQGGIANSAAGLLAALGNCPSSGNFLTATPFIAVNEVSTIAAAYAFAGFATAATHVSSTGTALAQIGIANAFANATNLAGISTGAALATTPAGNGTVPQAEINTLANILASCINSSGAVTGPTNPTACYTLFYAAQSAGSSGTIPSDTATAAINIAHNPGANIAGLYGLSTSNPPFGSALGTQPNDFTLSLTFTGGGLNSPNNVAIDASGNVWIANINGNSVTKLSNLGAVLSGSAGFTGGGLQFPDFIAIDQSDNAWVTNEAGDVVTEFSNAGTLLSGTTGFPIGSTQLEQGIAIDGTGNVWISTANSSYSISKLSSSGAILSGANGFTGGGLDYPVTVGIDGSGDVWTVNEIGSSLTKLSTTGAALSGANGYSGGGIVNPSGLAIDGSGNVWVPNQGAFNVTEVSNTGSILSGPSGFMSSGLTEPYKAAIDGSGNAWISNYANRAVVELSPSGAVLSGAGGYAIGATGTGAFKLAVDGSGDVWSSNGSGNSIGELIGAATPVITPIAAGLPATPTVDGSSSLGTRP